MMDFTTPPKKRHQAPPAHSWLDDEPPRTTPPASSRPHAPVATPPRQTAQDRKLSVSIQFSKPDFRRSRAVRSWLAAHVTKRLVVVSVIILLVVGASWASLAIRKHQLDARAAGRPAQSIANPDSRGTLDLPSFVPVVPATKQELLTPDGIHSQYDKAKASYSFSDSIKGQQFIVSQQQIATSLGSGQAAIDKVAGSLKATTKLKTGWGTAYVLTSSKNNSQTLVFGVRDLLLFIKAPFTLPNEQWTTYIDTLN